MTTAEATTQNH